MRYFLIFLYSVFFAVSLHATEGKRDLEDASSFSNSSVKRTRVEKDEASDSEWSDNEEEGFSPGFLERGDRNFQALTNPTGRQVYGIPTYDALFKYVLSDDTIRNAFIQCFVPEIKVKASKRLDEHMNPKQDFQVLRIFLKDKNNVQHIQRMHEDLKRGRTCLIRKDSQDKDSRGTDFMKKLLQHLPAMKEALPQERYDGTMDFVCKVNGNEFVLLEAQVIPQDHWDNRALAYASHYFGKQLEKGKNWDNLKRVIGINILGGGRKDEGHWQETPEQFIRLYQMQEQNHKPAKYMDGISIYQYALKNAPEAIEDQELQDWITFFKEGYRMTPEEVEQRIKTPAVKAAFERAKLADLPSKVQKAYEDQDREFLRYSEHTKKQVDEGVKKGLEKGLEKGREEGREEGREKEKKEIALKLLSMNMAVEDVAKATGLDIKKVQAISQQKLS